LQPFILRVRILFTFAFLWLQNLHYLPDIIGVSKLVILAGHAAGMCNVETRNARGIFWEAEA
jgi:hypothetical protein